MRFEARFHTVLALIGATYVVLVLTLLINDLTYTTLGHFGRSLADPGIRSALRLSLLTSGISTILAMWVATPFGYLLARVDFPGRSVIETIVDIPIVLPPVVVGMSLLLLMQSSAGRSIQQVLPVTYHVPAIVLAQFAVVTSFAIRTVRNTFAQMSPRTEQVAMTLGCTPAQAFWHVALPEARRGLFAATTLAWARAIGEFGPILVFAGITRMRTEVLPTSVFLELRNGNIEAAIAVSLVLVAIAVAVLLLMRRLEDRPNLAQAR